MKKKIFAIMMATLMSATLFASIGIAEIDVEIPDDAPKDIEIPDTLPIQPMIEIKDEHGKSTYDWNFYFDGSKYKIKNEGSGQRISYRVWNTGDDDISWNWYDVGYIYLGGQWVAWNVDYQTFTLESQEYYDETYWDEFPGGFHFFDQWVDPYNHIPESNDWGDNDGMKLWYF